MNPSSDVPDKKMSYEPHQESRLLVRGSSTSQTSFVGLGSRRLRFKKLVFSNDII